MKVSIIIPTRNAEKYIKSLIEALINQTIIPYEILVIDTASKDKTKEICTKYNRVKFIQINDGEFDHGGTRNKAAKEASGEILIFMTQDARPRNNKFIEEIIKKLGKDSIVASYGRQVANQNASYLEKFAREFNYTDKEIVKSKESIEMLGIKTFFMTNVCSAFLADEFWKVGGFPEKTILNEDMIISSKFILSQKKIHYSAKAEVIHSHNYTYIQQFKRNFDIGVSLVDNGEIIKYAKSESEGIKFVKAAIQHFMSINKIYLIPNLILDSGFRFLGYKIGLKYKILPIQLVKKMSMHSFYFNNKKDKVEVMQ